MNWSPARQWQLGRGDVIEADVKRSKCKDPRAIFDCGSCRVASVSTPDSGLDFVAIRTPRSDSSPAERNASSSVHGTLTRLSGCDDLRKVIRAFTVEMVSEIRLLQSQDNRIISRLSSHISPLPETETGQRYRVSTRRCGDQVCVCDAAALIRSSFRVAQRRRPGNDKACR